MRHRPLPVDRSNLHPHQHIHTHTHHRLYTHRLDTHTHTHLPCCATPPSGGALALHTPTTPRRRIPRNSACTYTRMRVSVRAHACCTGKRRPGLFSLRFSSRVTGCSTHPVSHTTCALRLPCREFIFRPHSTTGCLTHFHTHTICLDAVKCVSPSQHSTCLHAVLLFHILEIDTEEEGKETND